ncbi:TldD/PmbA family protein [Candidatus Fermentibacteria bacterium]|nr:TldD/PmbA family protein [Candidatus Fermentibacteria bacterium]
MREYTEIALGIAQEAGASFADMRVVEERENRIFVKRRSLRLIDEAESFGYAVRMLIDGAWGFASSTTLSRDAVAKTAHRAVATAQASSKARRTPPLVMAPEPAHVATCIGPCEEDPFAVPHGEKADLLLSACDAMLGVPGVVMTLGLLEFSRVHRIIATTDGTYVDMTTTFANPMLQAVAVKNGESQERSYQGGARQAGYEFIRSLDLAGRARWWAEEAVLKCCADPSPVGVMDLVLDPDHLALTMHESVGHPTELDRILGWESNFAGRSFIRPNDVGSLKYGSEIVNFTVDNTMPGGAGSWFFDDDGVAMQKFPIIRDGILVGLGTTRETAPLIGWEHSVGCCRADGFRSFPINRIPNLYMEPGSREEVTPESLIAGVDRGVYIQGRGSFSIDQMRNNFQFGGDMFWMIEGGTVTKPLKKVTYQSQTRQFWGSCDAIAGPSHWKPFGLMNCGKGEPSQRMRMTHGASYCRFRAIRVGEAKV